MKNKNKIEDGLRAEYHFDYSKAVRGKYYQKLLKQGANIIVLDPDLAELFPDSASVNKALRTLVENPKNTTHEE